MFLKAKEILDYYDYPLLFISENKEGNLYLCSLIVEKESYLFYGVAPITSEQVKKLKCELKTESTSLLRKLVNSCVGSIKLNRDSPKWFKMEEF